MSQPTYGDWLHIMVGFDLPEEERRFVHGSVVEMFNELAPLKVKTDAGPLGRGPGPAEYLAAITEIAGAVGGVATTASAIAQAIIAWRRKLQQKNIKVPLTLEAPGKPPIDLNTATNEQIRIYIIKVQGPPDHEK